MVLPFDKKPLWVLICFFGAIDTRERLFEEDYGLDGKKTLSMNSDLNESTNLWWIKTGSPWIDPPQAKFGRSPGMLPVRAHRRRYTFQVRSTDVVST